MKHAYVIIWLAIFSLSMYGTSAQEQSDNSTGNKNLPRPRHDLSKLKREIVPTLSDSHIKSQFSSFINKPVSHLKGDLKLLSTQLKQKVNIFQGPLFQVKDYRFDLNGMINQPGIDSPHVFPVSQNILDYNLRFTSSISHLPFELGVTGNTNNIYTTTNRPFDNLYKFNFDHKKYVADIQNSLMKKLSPDVIAATVLDKINTVRRQYEKQLWNEIDGIQKSFLKEYNIPLDIPSEFVDISVTDLSSLRNKLLNGPAQDVLQRGIGVMGDKLNVPNTDLSNREAVAKLAESSIRRVEALEQVYEKIVKVKAAFDNNPAVQQLRNIIPVTPATYKAFISNPANLEKVLDDHVNLNTVQRLFFNITKLDIGQNAIKSGEFSLENLVHTGINTAFKNRKSSFGFIYGKSDRINNWMQTGLQNLAGNEYSRLTGFQFGTGTSARFEQSVSINLFDFNSPLPVSSRDLNQQSEYLPTPRHKDATITYHSAFSVKKTNRISVDISKSFGSFTENFTSDSLMYKTNPYSSLLGSEGKANYAARVEYAGDLWDSEIAAYFKKVGLGYNNPGNAYLNRGETSVGLRFGKKLLKNKLAIRYYGDYRRQVFDPAKNYFHNAFNNKMQVGLKLKRNSRINLSYAQNNSQTKFVGEDSRNGINSRIQADGSYKLRIGHKNVINYVTLSRQSLQLPMVGGTEFSNRLLLFVHSSTILLNKNMLTLSVLVNRSDSDEFYFSTSSSSVETNYGFPAFNDKIRLNSAVGYYSNTGWNKQIGIKQQVNASLFQKFNIDLEVGYKKAVQVIHRELANQFYATVMTHYHF